ncbi:hypothetical protein NDU88_006257 [Pleurodeles waltl]|uniref:Uncharacterized protein n=1 Tax=Pleurodeles waltl TaxID=8319 RepID=A0AAV7MEG0_PLEWA|nr:hypothetical protein NDU88_006257 [Pleurodeles waltl]
MLVGSVLPLRQRSIGREGGGRRRPGRLPAPGAADEPLSRRRLYDYRVICFVCDRGQINFDEITFLSNVSFVFAIC